jgi:hypothetical protein
MGISLTNCYAKREEMEDGKVNENEGKRLVLKSNPKKYLI